jgi:hypothetical protein
MSERITVEVFRDATASSFLDTTLALKGLANIANHIDEDPFKVINDSRKLKITNNETDDVKLSAVNWPPLEANYSIILTDKVIARDTEGAEVSGSALRLGTIKGVAAIRANIDEPELVAAHEIGHLMNLRYPDDLGEERHCTTTRCLMQQRTTKETVEKRIPKKGIPGFLERYGYLPPEYQKVERVAGRTFCPSCTEQLAKRAFFALRYLRGEYVHPNWL